MSISDQGKKTAIVLGKYFPEIVDAKYTAQMEVKLDDVQEGNESRIKILTDFYNPFEERIKVAYEKNVPPMNQKRQEKIVLFADHP